MGLGKPVAWQIPCQCPEAAGSQKKGGRKEGGAREGEGRDGTE